MNNDIENKEIKYAKINKKTLEYCRQKIKGIIF